MKKIFVVFALLLMLACVKPAEQPTEKESIKQPEVQTNVTGLDIVLAAFKVIDDKHNTTWKEERVYVKTINPEVVDLAIQDVETAKAETSQKPLENMSLLLELFDARLAMLKSQKYFFEAEKMGEGIMIRNIEMTAPGKFETSESINCSFKDKIIQAINVYNDSVRQGHDFLTYMDEVLQNSTEAREKIGLNEKRPAFYKSDLGRVVVITQFNSNMVKRCK
jgi:hypothetical protein